MATESREHKATAKALDKITAYIQPGTNEGISWSLSRVTESLFGDSFLAGGDASRFTASGKRGTLNSQQSTAYFLDGGGGVPTQVPIALSFNLNKGVVSLSWTPPAQPAKAVTFKVEHYKTISPAPNAGADVTFNADTASDGAAYTLLLMLL